MTQEIRDAEFAAGRQTRKDDGKFNAKLNAKQSRDWIDGWSTEDCRIRSKTDSRKSALRRALQSGATYADFLDGSTN